jgi:putative FmdB family regulatory protein
MPVYEYFCSSCDGVFELLRPVREASQDQPCVQCDRDAKRIMSREFAAFTFREGWPRRLPDDGSYWHFEQKVSSPINGPSYQGVTHPGLDPSGSHLQAPTLEEIEHWEQELSARREVEGEIDGTIINTDFEREKAAFAERLSATRGTRRVEDAKRRLIRKDLEDVVRVHQKKARRAQ